VNFSPAPSKYRYPLSVLDENSISKNHPRKTQRNMSETVILRIFAVWKNKKTKIISPFFLRATPCLLHSALHQANIPARIRGQWALKSSILNGSPRKRLWTLTPVAGSKLLKNKVPRKKKVSILGNFLRILGAAEWILQCNL